MKNINNLPKFKYTWLPTLYSIIYNLEPNKIIEYGTQTGATAVTMALALKELYEESGHKGHVYTYDLFDKNNKDSIYVRDIENKFLPDMAKLRVIDHQVTNFITISYGDFANNNISEDCDLLYFDIGNHGDNILSMYNQLKTHIDNGLIVLFEGGSQVRDEVEWMINLNKKPINSIKNTIQYKLLTENTRYSLSCIYNTNKYNLI